MVNATERDRVRALQLMVQAMPPGHEGRKPRRGGRLPAIAGRHVVEQPRLRRGVAAAIPDRLEDVARLRAGLGIRPRKPSGARSMPTAIRSSITCRRVSRPPTTDGQRWRWCLQQDRRNESAVAQSPCGGNSPNSSKTNSACRRWPNGAGDSAAWRPTTRRTTRAARTPCTRSRKPRRSPGSPRASSGSICPTSSTTSKFTSRSPPSRKPVYAIGGVGAVGPDFREPAAVSEGGRVLAAAVEGSFRAELNAARMAATARPDRRQLGPIRADANAARRPGPDARISLPKRRASRVHRQRNRRAKALGRREGIPEVESARISTGRRSTSATSAIGWCRRIRSNTSAGRLPSGRCRLKPREKHFDKSRSGHSADDHARRVLGDGQDEGRKHVAGRRLDRRHGDRQEIARRQDVLLRRRRRQRKADRKGQRRVLRLAASSTTTSRRNTTSIPSTSPNSPTPTAR